MPGLFEIKINDFGLRERLTRASKFSTANLKTGLEQVAKKWMRLIDDGFTQERDPYGMGWAPLAARTIKKKKKLGYKNPTAILQASGKMRKSFAYHVTSRGFTIFNNRPAFPDGSAADIHQTGGQGEFQIPPRPMVPEFERGVPDEWFEAAKASITYAMRQYMEKN